MLLQVGVGVMELPNVFISNTCIAYVVIGDRKPYFGPPIGLPGGMGSA